jgi:hypothetical protein
MDDSTLNVCGLMEEGLVEATGLGRKQLTFHFIFQSSLVMTIPVDLGHPLRKRPHDRHRDGFQQLMTCLSGRAPDPRAIEFCQIRMRRTACSSFGPSGQWMRISPFSVVISISTILVVQRGIILEQLADVREDHCCWIAEERHTTAAPRTSGEC